MGTLRTSAHRLALFASAILLIGLTTTLLSAAAFTSATGAAGSQFVVDVLEPPTLLTADTSDPSETVLDWTATTDSYADGYQILRSATSGSGHTVIDTVAGRTTATFTDGFCTPTTGPLFRSAGTAATAISAASLTVDIPSGTESGDVLVAHLTLDDDSVITEPAGWTALTEIASGGRVMTGLYYRVADGTETATYTWNLSNSQHMTLTLLRYAGVDNVSPIDDWGTSTGATATPTAPAVTTTVDGARVVRLFSTDDSMLENSSYPSGLTRRPRLFNNSSAEVSSLIADTIQGTAGTTGTSSAPIASANEWVGATIALTPAATSQCEEPVIADFSIASTSAGTSLAIPVPTGTASGDYLITFIAVDDPWPSITPPAGWTSIVLVESGIGATPVSGALYRRVADGTEPSSYTFTWTGSQAAAGTILQLTGVDTTSPSDGIAVTQGDSGTASSGSITTAHHNTRVFHFILTDNRRLDGGSYPDGHTALVQIADGDIDIGIAETLQTTPGATGASTIPLTGADDWGVITHGVPREPPGPYFYVVRSTAGTWTSLNSNEAS